MKSDFKTTRNDGNNLEMKQLTLYGISSKLKPTIHDTTQAARNSNSSHSPLQILKNSRRFSLRGFHLFFFFLGRFTQ